MESGNKSTKDINKEKKCKRESQQGLRMSCLIGHISHLCFFLLSNIFDLQPQLFVQDLTLFFVLATFLSQPKEAESSSSTIVAGQTYAM